MFTWLRNLFARSKSRKAVDDAIENMPTNYAQNKDNRLPLDPGKYPLQ